MPSLKNEISPVLLIGIIIMGFVFGYFYYSQILQGEIPKMPPAAIAPNDMLAKFKDIQLNFSALDDKSFTSLKILGESPINPGATGRTDIFAPF